MNSVTMNPVVKQGLAFRRLCGAVGHLSGAVTLTALVAGLTMPVAAFAQEAVPVAVPLVVPKNLTYWQMFAHATLVVKLVMMVLLMASVATWTIWISKLVELKNANRRLRADLAMLGTVDALGKVGELQHGAPAGMLQLVRTEFARTGEIATVEAGEGVKERLAARFVTVEAGAIERMLRGASVLATVGAITPFVGLFGTVWGIMNSFIGISQSNTTNLAVVAPGIAEALLATAMGLVAAIPAVIMYNHVARSVAGYRRNLADASTQVACLVSHEVDVKLGARGSVRAAAA
ncbi:tonB-system energizer ExbB [Sphingomonas colocasiae]|nr:tonB-system energizer ExbB [Sphingomonas colocasiae]